MTKFINIKLYLNLDLYMSKDIFMFDLNVKPAKMFISFLNISSNSFKKHKLKVEIIKL